MDISLKVGKKELISNYSIALPANENRISITIEDITITFEFIDMADDASDEKIKNWNVDAIDKNLVFKINRSTKKSVQVGTTGGYPRIAKIDGLDIYLGFAFQSNSKAMSFINISLFRECRDDSNE